MAQYQYRCDLCGHKTGWHPDDASADSEYLGHMGVHLDPPPDFGPPRKASWRSRTTWSGPSGWQPEKNPYIPITENCVVCGASCTLGVDRARSAPRITCGKPKCEASYRRNAT